MKLRYVVLAVLMFLLAPAAAFAGDEVVPPQHALALPTTQVWVIIAAALVPAITYLLNHYAPWVDDKVKSVVFVAAAAVAAAVAQAIDAGNVGFNDETLQLVVSGVAVALAAHFGFWKPSGIGAVLGQGTNHQDPPAV